MSTPTYSRHAGFSLVEMIMVIVITGIISGMVAMFLRTPIQQYMDVSRRTELTDIADTAIRRMARDVRIAVPNSVRVPNQTGCTAAPAVPCAVEFLLTKDGGRYRAGNPGDRLIFDGTDKTFDIIGTANVAAGDYIVIGSTQSDGSIAYDAAASGVLRAVSAASGVIPTVTGVTLASGLPWTAELSTQRFAVIDTVQQAVTYACEGVNTVDGNGTGQLKRYWKYGFNSAQPPTPITTQAPVPPNTTPVQSAIIADKISDCQINYEIPNQRFSLLTVRLTLTSGGESVSLYNEIHVNNAP